MNSYAEEDMLGAEVVAFAAYAQCAWPCRWRAAAIVAAAAVAVAPIVATPIAVAVAPIAVLPGRWGRR